MANGGKRQARKIPEATVTRLPLYLRSLLEVADDGMPTISSERLAEMSGVNAAKVRKDLSYLGSYGTRGVGYDVEYLLFQMSRELGLTHDWHVVIAGVGNLGHALANYGGLPRAGLSRGRPRRRRPPRHRHRGQRHPRAPHRRAAGHRRQPADRHRHHRHPRQRRPGGGRPHDRCGGQLDPQLRTDDPVGARRRVAAQGRPRGRAADPQLLPAAQDGVRTAWPRWPPKRRHRRRPSGTRGAEPTHARRSPRLPGQSDRRRPAGAWSSGAARSHCTRCVDSSRPVPG